MRPAGAVEAGTAACVAVWSGEGWVRSGAADGVPEKARSRGDADRDGTALGDGRQVSATSSTS
ncbi:hypothetical protein Axi01nite_06900 [Actinoplanes xinjiangensis]|nr:hypothetical protein Axi01nite_06900 [Actinoplanes xinjiangensis]